jgi:integrase
MTTALAAPADEPEEPDRSAVAPQRKRRGRGEGSIYQLPNGKWRGVVDLGWSNGKRRRKYVTRASRAEAVREVRRLTNEAERGQLSSGRVPTVAEWMDTYLREVAAATLRPSSLHRYQQEVRLYIGPGLGRHKLDKLRPAHLSAFYRKQSEKLSAGSVRRLHAILRRALTIAVRWQLIPTNPATMVDPPPLKHAEVRAYSVEEARRFLSVVAGTRMEARWVLAIALGLRQGEALGLSWENVDLDSGTLRIRQALQYQPGHGLEVVEPKTARSRRTVPLPISVVAVLRAHQERQQQAREAAGHRWIETGLVFTTATGTPISPRNDYRTFRELLVRGDLRRIRLHDLRHTAASLLLAQGESPRVIMEILGHSQISVTMNTYSHVSPEVARDAATRMNNLLWPE